MKKQRILINGGGVPGLVLAHALARLDLDITLVEPHPPEKPPTIDGRTVAIMARHVTWLEDLGLWADIAPQTGQLTTMRIIDHSIAGKRAAPPHDFKASAIGQTAFAWNTPLAALRHHLWSGLPDTVRILDQKPEDNFDLIIAADGRHSPTRGEAGITTTTHDTRQSALTFVVRRASPHHGISTEYQRPHGPVTLVPLPDPYLCSVVYVDETAVQQALLAQGSAAIAQSLQNITGENIQIISEIDIYPLIFLQADALYKNNTILAAEAAHVLHPMGAQGMNLSLQDMKTLSELIENALKLGLSIADPHAVLRAYHTARHADHTIRMRGVMTSLDFLRHGTLTGGVRRGFLGLLNRLPALERTLIKVAQ